MTDRPRSHDDDGRRFREGLADASGHVPSDSVDWEAFHTRLSARAERPLSALRHPQLAVALATQLSGRPDPVRNTQWWEHAARWSRLTVSASIAAGIVLVAVVRMSPKETTELATSTVVATTSDQIEQTRAEFESAVVGRTAAWTIDSALMPSATDLLIPLGRDGASR